MPRRRALVLVVAILVLLVVAVAAGTWMLRGGGGTGLPAGPAPGGMAADSTLAAPAGLAIDARGNLYVSEQEGHRVDQIAPDGAMFAVAGKGSAGFSGDGTNGTSAQLDAPTGLIAPADGSLWIADTGNDRVRRMGSDGFVETVPGASPPRLSEPVGIALDGDGNLFVADAAHGRVVRVEPGAVVAAIASGLAAPAYLALDGGAVVVAETGANRVVRIDAAGTVTTVAGAEAGLLGPTGVAVGPHGTVYVSDAGHDRVVRIEDDGTAVVVAGTGTAGFSGDGGKAVDAEIDDPAGLVFDGAGNLYVADRGNDRVRRIDSSGVIETVAGGA